MAYRPQYKNKNGNIVDLPLDAETVRGKEVYSKEETDTRIAEKLDEKQTTECNCSHEVEITGFGEEDCNLVIDDQDVVITKIQGQTRKKSLNLLNIADGKVTLVAENVSYKSAHYKMPCKSNTTYTISIKYNQSANNGHLAIITHYTDENPLEDSSGTIFKTLTTLDETTMQFNFYATTGTAATNTINFTEIMVVEGTYTKDTMPQFEPYDNNLVNSKCDFISTGRNLCNGILEFYNTYLYVIRGCRLKPNTTYTISSNLVLGGNFIVTVAKNTWDESIKLTSDYGNFPTTFTTPSTLEVGDDWIIDIRGTFTNSNNGNVMLNYGDTALPYEPNVEDTMKCGLELGAFDYHDNVNHITHRQTSEKWTWVPSQSIRAGGAYTYGYRLDIKLFNDTNMGETKGISNWEYNFNMIANPNVNNNNSICVFNQHLYVFVNGATSESEARAVLDANPPQLVYKRTTETTETNILPSGYKVWYKGMQIQKTNTLPYILTKQYGISLASQVLNNVAIDRSQQKQIDELYRNKANSSDVYKKSETDSLLNGRFGKWRFENGSLYSGVNPIVGDYYELVGTCTTLGSEDYDTIIIGYDSRPKYFEAGTIKVKEIALLEDVTSITTAIAGSLSNLETTNKTNLVSAINEVKNTQPHLFRHQISFSESTLSYVSFEIILSYPTAINTKDKIKAILTDNYYTSIQRAKIATGIAPGQGYIFDAIYINNGELFAGEITTPSTSISIEGICVNIEDTITQIF